MWNSTVEFIALFHAWGCGAIGGRFRLPGKKSGNHYIGITARELLPMRIACALWEQHARFRSGVTM